MPDTEYDDADVIADQEYLLNEARRQREMRLLYDAIQADIREHDELQAVFSQWMKYSDENDKNWKQIKEANARRDFDEFRSVI